MRCAAVGLLALVVGGCIDFEDPDLSEAGQPALLQILIHLDEAGQLDVDGILIPGLTQEGRRRTVPNDTVRVLGLAIAPSETASNGTRTYELRTTLSGPQPTARALTVSPPQIVGSSAAPASVQWQGIRRLDPDTILVAAAGDVVLHTELTPATANPIPVTRSWNVDLVSAEGNFRFGANGVPPGTIRIPSFWIPAASNGRVAVYLSYFQSGAYRPAPGDYTVSVGTDVRTRWTLRILPTP
jgi:hypothetical protein